MTAQTAEPTPRDLFDVLAVNIKTSKVRLLGERLTDKNADAIVKLAVMRRGVTEEFYTIKPTGSHQDGDTLKRGGAPA